MSDSSMSDALPRSAHRDSSFGLALLRGLGEHARHVYGGTVDPATVATRRRQNKAARKARRVTRRRA